MGLLATAMSKLAVAVKLSTTNMAGVVEEKCTTIMKARAVATNIGTGFFTPEVMNVAIPTYSIHHTKRVAMTAWWLKDNMSHAVPV